MTAALLKEIQNVGAYSASLAHSPYLVILYWILGIIAAISYNLGSCFPLKTRKTSTIQESIIAPHESPPKSKALFVVIPAFIESDQDAKHLQLAVNRLPIPEQIIVVDDASPIKFKLRGCILIRHPENLGPAAARNTGMTAAFKQSATSIAFTDADCLPSPDWASKHALLQSLSPGIWAGKTLAHDNGIISTFHNAVGTLMPRLEDDGVDAIYAPTCNLSISSSVAQKMKFDASFPTSAFEDCEFCVRARALGFPVRVSSGPVVRHRFRDGIVGLSQAYFKYGRSFPIMLKKHPMYKSMLRNSHPMSTLTWKTLDNGVEES